jgi:hypothetical protein
MKIPKTALFLAMIFVCVIIAYSFVDKVSEKNTSIAQNQATTDKNQKPTVSNSAADKQDPTEKANSFSVQKVVGEVQDIPNATTDMIIKGKNYLLTQVNHRIRQLRPFKDNFEKMANLNDSERKNLVTELNAEIAMFEALKPEISQSATKGDVKNVADKVKAVWLKSRLSVERAEESVLVSKENQLVADADVASTSIQKRIDTIKAAGKDAKAYEKLLAAYSKKVASAKQDMGSAKEKSNAVASASTDDEKEKLVKGKDLLLSSSQENIRDAYKLLKEGAREDFAQRFK